MNEFDFKYELIRNGEKFKEGTFTVDAAAGETKAVTLNIPMVKMAAGNELLLNVFAFQRNATPSVPAGLEMAREQFGTTGNYFDKDATVSGTLKIDKTSDRLNFSSGNIKGSFDLITGNLTSYSLKNADLLQRFFSGERGIFPEPYFWRAPTDNDFGNGFNEYARAWSGAHVNKKMKSIEAKDNLLTVVYRLPDVRADYTMTYLIQKDGSIKVNALLQLPADSEAPELPRMGLRVKLPPSLNQLEWYGRGPFENYSDRNTASTLGIWQNHTDNGWTKNYIRPQESGYRTDVRWLTLLDDKGFGLQVEGLQPLSISAMPQLTEDFDEGAVKKNRHITDINKRPYTVLHIDYAQRGVGGDNTWGAQTHEEYRLFAKQYSYGFVMRVVGK